MPQRVPILAQAAECVRDMLLPLDQGACAEPSDGTQMPQNRPEGLRIRFRVGLPIRVLVACQSSGLTFCPSGSGLNKDGTFVPSLLIVSIGLFGALPAVSSGWMTYAIGWMREPNERLGWCDLCGREASGGHLPCHGIFPLTAGLTALGPATNWNRTVERRLRRRRRLPALTSRMTWSREID